MLFEKKMIILSGESGKGVVLIERSGLGVKFALRTFGVRGGLMAGIVTPDRVIVRDLPNTPDPSAVFYVDNIELESLHFAVFGKEIALYGAIGKRMWTSNLMDILNRHAFRQSADASPALAPLKPIAERPQVLPPADGTGIPQTRLELYGDEAIAADNFYTGIDINSAMPRIDSFLDGARLVSDAPPVQKAERVGFSVGMAETTACAADGENEKEEIETEKAETMGDTENVGISGLETVEPKDRQASFADELEESGAEAAAESAVRAVNEGSGDGFSEASDKADSRCAVPWWKRQAEYIRSLATREATAASIPSVKKIAPSSAKKIREASFFERTKPDVDKLFSGAPRDGEISKLIEGEWVKVAFDGNTISVGRLADSVICYAVAGVYEKTSPFGSSAQWLPKVPSVPTGKGYWLIFQNLSDGEIIR